MFLFTFVQDLELPTGLLGLLPLFQWHKSQEGKEVGRFTKEETRSSVDHHCWIHCLCLLPTPVPPPECLVPPPPHLCSIPTPAQMHQTRAQRQLQNGCCTLFHRCNSAVRIELLVSCLSTGQVRFQGFVLELKCTDPWTAKLYWPNRASLTPLKAQS